MAVLRTYLHLWFVGVTFPFMSTGRLIADDSPLASRQPRTDRLVLPTLLDAASRDNRLNDDIEAAHRIVMRWVEMESSGRLADFTEVQIRGDFLNEVFGSALGYVRPVDNADQWNLFPEFQIEGQPADAALGIFRRDEQHLPLAVVEIKGPLVHLDRHRSNGRTAVDQCWDYLNNTPPTCRWGIVSNIVSFRLYERNSTKRRYEHFSLRSLRDIRRFREFYVLFSRRGLVESVFGQPPIAVALLRDTGQRQREIGDELYDAYSDHRLRLIRHLHVEQNKSVDDSIEMAQRLLDRVIFVAFCEDRHLLPEQTIARASLVSGFHAVTNPRWQSFKNLFRFIDQGNAALDIPAYNGGLFAPHMTDDLELDDTPWTGFFKTIGDYDFRDSVNLDVLGHLFEQSITELERLKTTGLFQDAEVVERYATMPQSVKRKQLGIYYTPPELTGLIVEYTVQELIAERFAELATEYGIRRAVARRGIAPDDPEYWQRCFDILRNLKIVDPACGSGAFLFQAYHVLESRYDEVIGHLAHAGRADAIDLETQIPTFILNDNLYGVDLSPEAVEITQLALWIRSATRGQLLANLSRNIVQGNSLVHDPAVHPDGFNWRERFPEVFDREESGFDCVIGNPPWERIKLQEREFFSLPAPEIATATNAAKRRKLVKELERRNPALFARYRQAQDSANELLTYCRRSGEYPLTGRGDINTYAVFAELAYNLVAPRGRVGFLTPSGIASDNTTKDFFAAIAESTRLIRLYDFENRTRTFFPEVDNRFKFCILNFGGSEIEHNAADFVFFLHDVDGLTDRQRHIELTGDDIRLMNPNTRTCPIFRSRRDAEITRAIYQRVPILIDESREGPTGNPWGIKFKTMFHQTNDAELFREPETLEKDGFRLRGNRYVKRRESFLPLYEAKMIQAYDHRAASVVTDRANWVRQGQTEPATLVQSQNPEHLAMPRFWIEQSNVELAEWGALGFKDITSPTNQRTVIAAIAPLAGFTNHFVLSLSDSSPLRQLCLLANLNSFVYDYVTRQKIGGVTLNFFIVQQLPTLQPDVYERPCPWQRDETLETWISERVLKLTCTAEDMLPLAEACNFTSGIFQREYGGRLNRWDEEERARLMAELDAAYFHLYGINRDDAEYILSTFNGIHDPTPLFPGSPTTAEFILNLYETLS
jgi:hypothetical protein